MRMRKNERDHGVEGMCITDHRAGGEEKKTYLARSLSINKVVVNVSLGKSSNGIR